MPKEKEITKEMRAIYAQGFMRATWLFAYWKNGIQFVGNTGKKLSVALGEAPISIKQYCRRDVHEIINTKG